MSSSVVCLIVEALRFAFGAPVVSTNQIWEVVAGKSNYQPNKYQLRVQNDQSYYQWE